MKSLIWFLFAVCSQAALAAKTYVPFKDTPTELKQALKVSFQVDSESSNSSKSKIVLVLETVGTFKIYEESLSFENLSQSRGFSLIETSRPKTSRFIDPITKQVKSGFKGQSEFDFDVTQPPNDSLFTLGVKLQVCSDKICLFPTQFSLDLDLTPTAPAVAQPQSLSIQSRIQNLFSFDTSSKSFVFLLLFFSGLITAFTPCVYPLYPITLGIFSRWRTVSDSNLKPMKWVITYCAGLTLSYAVLGLVTAATGSLFGSFTQKPVFLFSIATLILFSAFVFQGTLELSWLSKLQAVFSKPTPQNEIQKAPRAYRVFLMGATLGLVASPCVGPVLVTLLAWLSGQLTTGSSTDYLLGFFYLAAFGFGMCVPFLVMGHFIFRTGKNLSLGKWTRIGKYFGTAMMLATAGYFYFMGWKTLNPKVTDLTKQFQVYSYDTWDKSYKTVIDFRTEWCVACHELEQFTFSDPKIAEFFKSGEWRFVQIDLTDESTDPKQREIAEKYNIISVPRVMLWNGTQFCDNLTLYEFENAERFLTRIQSVQDNCKAK